MTLLAISIGDEARLQNTNGDDSHNQTWVGVYAASAYDSDSIRLGDTTTVINVVTQPGSVKPPVTHVVTTPRISDSTGNPCHNDTGLGDNTCDCWAPCSETKPGSAMPPVIIAVTARQLGDTSGDRRGDTIWLGDHTGDLHDVTKLTYKTIDLHADNIWLGGVTGDLPSRTLVR